MSENFASLHDPMTAQVIQLLLARLEAGVTEHITSWITVLRNLIDWTKIAERVMNHFGAGDDANMNRLADRFWEWVQGDITPRLMIICLSPDDFVYDPGRYTRCKAYIDWSERRMQGQANS